MKIVRILTNNALVSLDEKGKEQIVCGKGIGYKKRVGDSVEIERIDKVYVVAADDKVRSQLERLLTEIPVDYVELAHSIVKMARLSLNMELSDSLIISLADHLYMTMQRFKEGMDIANGLSWEIQQYYEKEFEAGLMALDMVEQQFGTRLPEAEAAYIAMHIVNAETADSSMEETYRITKVIQDITHIVRVYFKVEFDTASSYYYRFITHLKYFARRVLRQEQFSENSSEDLAEIIFAKYRNPYLCARKVGEYLRKKYNYQLTAEETMYLTIHIQLVVNKGSKKEAETD